MTTESDIRARYPWLVECPDADDRTRALKNLRAELKFTYPSVKLRARIVRDCLVIRNPFRSTVDQMELIALATKYWPTAQENSALKKFIGSAFVDVETEVRK